MNEWEKLHLDVPLKYTCPKVQSHQNEPC